MQASDLRANEIALGNNVNVAWYVCVYVVEYINASVVDVVILAICFKFIFVMQHVLFLTIFLFYLF